MLGEVRIDALTLLVLGGFAAALAWLLEAPAAPARAGARDCRLDAGRGGGPAKRLIDGHESAQRDVDRRGLALAPARKAPASVAQIRRKAACWVPGRATAGWSQ